MTASSSVTYQQYERNDDHSRRNYYYKPHIYAGISQLFTRFYVFNDGRNSWNCWWWITGGVDGKIRGGIVIVKGTA